MDNKKYKFYFLPQQHAKSNRIGDNEQTPGNITGHLIKSCSLQQKQQKLRLTILSGATSNTTHGPDFHTTGICVAVKKLAPKLVGTDLSSTIRCPFSYSKTKAVPETLGHYYVAGNSVEKLQSWSNIQIGDQCNTS